MFELGSAKKQLCMWDLSTSLVANCTCAVACMLLHDMLLKLPVSSENDLMRSNQRG